MVIESGCKNSRIVSRINSMFFPNCGKNCIYAHYFWIFSTWNNKQKIKW